MTDEKIAVMMQEHVQPIVRHYGVEFDPLAWLDTRPDVRAELRQREHISDGLRLLRGHLSPLLEEMQRVKQAA